MSFLDPNAGHMAYGNPNYRSRPGRGCRPRLGCLSTLVTLAALLFVSYATFAHNWPIFGPTTITVHAHPTLIIHSQRYEKIDLPTIHVHTGTASDKIILQIGSPANIALPWNIGINGFQQNSDKSVTIIDGDPVEGRRLDITVPTNTDLKLYTNSANIDVTGVTGQMTLISNEGKITLTHCNVTGTSLFDNNNGAITVTQSNLDGEATFNNNDGPITLQGAIGTTGTYTIDNNQGPIEATLPQGITFHLDAFTNNGLITTDYPGTQVQNKEMHANIGGSAQARLALHTNAGTITLHAQKGA